MATGAWPGGIASVWQNGSQNAHKQCRCTGRDQSSGARKTVKVELQLGEAAGVMLHQMYKFEWISNFTLQKDTAGLFWQT